MWKLFNILKHKTPIVESDIPKEQEKALQAEVNQLDVAQAKEMLRQLHTKVEAGQNTPEEGAKYHFLKSRIKALKTSAVKTNKPTMDQLKVKMQAGTATPEERQQYNDMRSQTAEIGKVGYKTKNVRTLSDYGVMTHPTDYTQKKLPKDIIHSIGNSKLGEDTLVFNMGAAWDCPSRKLGMCQVCIGKGVCYALKAEIQYQGDTSSAIRKRRMQGDQWKKFSVENIAKQMADIIVKKGIKYIRINESGDFDSQVDVDKVSQLADLLEGKATVYMYTARKDLDFSNLSDNLVINGSGHMVHNDFHFVPKEEFDKIPGDAKVCGGDCPQCTLCKTRGGETIYAKEH